jgi:alpha-methylacyl-CoA racemase
MQTDRSVERPLHSLRVIEFEGIGPGPLAGRMLSDLGAHVIVVARPTPSAVDRTLIGENTENPLRQGKEIIVLDLKTANGVIAALNLVSKADALIEGNRPDVMERLGLGPAECAARNPRLVYGRITGWGQNGPLAQAAGHDLNYIALTGLLSLSCRSGTAPIVPPTVLGDAAGALGLCFGMVSAVLDARSSGRGRVVDAAIIDVVAMLGTLVQGVRANGQIDGPQPSPFYDSPFYDAYVCGQAVHHNRRAGTAVLRSALEKAGTRRHRSRRAVRSQSVARFEGAALGAVRKPSQRPLVSPARGKRRLFQPGAKY